MRKSRRENKGNWFRRNWGYFFAPLSVGILLAFANVVVSKTFNQAKADSIPLRRQEIKADSVRGSNLQQQDGSGNSQIQQSGGRNTANVQMNSPKINHNTIIQRKDSSRSRVIVNGGQPNINLGTNNGQIGNNYSCYYYIRGELFITSPGLNNLLSKIEQFRRDSTTGERLIVLYSTQFNSLGIVNQIDSFLQSNGYITFYGTAMYERTISGFSLARRQVPNKGMELTIGLLSQ